MMRIAWFVGVTATSLLLMASTSVAQLFCSDLDGLVKLAPSGFRPILNAANGGAVETGVARSLPGASRCWVENVPGSGVYWCLWDVPMSQVENQVKQLASIVGQCYQVQPDYESIHLDNETTTAGGEVFAFVDLPNSISIYINGVGDTVAMSIRGNDKTRSLDTSP